MVPTSSIAAAARVAPRQLLTARTARQCHATAAFTTTAATCSPVKATDVAALRDIVRRGDAEAALCGTFMPSAARESFYAVRAMNIEVAAIRDVTRGNVNAARLRLGFWRGLIDSVYSGESHAHYLAQPLRNAVLQHHHTRRWFDRLIEAREADLDARAPRSIAELEAYGEGTTGAMLSLALEACGVQQDEADHAAIHIGKASSIVTAIRALPIHARLGQRYIPDDVMARHGLRERDLAPPRVAVASGAAPPVSPPGHRGAAFTAGWKGGKVDPAELEHERAELRRIAQERLAAAAAAAATGSSELHTESPVAAPKATSSRASRIVVGEGAVKRAASKPPAVPAVEVSLTPQPPPLTPQQQKGGGGGSSIDSLPSFFGDPQTAARMGEAVLELATVARAHVRHARELAPSLPAAAAPALLPAVPLWRFLERLQQQNFDLTATSASGVWHDGRPLARVYLLGDLLSHAVRGRY